MRSTIGLLLITGLAVGGCAGDGSALEQTMAGPGIEPTLSSIQSEVFGAICIECHIPAGPGPMPLDSEDVSFQNLVGVRSVLVFVTHVVP